MSRRWGGRACGQSRGGPGDQRRGAQGNVEITDLVPGRVDCEVFVPLHTAHFGVVRDVVARVVLKVVRVVRELVERQQRHHNLVLATEVQPCGRFDVQFELVALPRRVDVDWRGVDGVTGGTGVGPEHPEPRLDGVVPRVPGELSGAQVAHMGRVHCRPPARVAAAGLRSAATQDRQK